MSGALPPFQLKRHNHSFLCSDIGHTLPSMACASLSVDKVLFLNLLSLITVVCGHMTFVMFDQLFTFSGQFSLHMNKERDCLCTNLISLQKCLVTEFSLSLPLDLTLPGLFQDSKIKSAVFLRNSCQ